MTNRERLLEERVNILSAQVVSLRREIAGWMDELAAARLIVRYASQHCEMTPELVELHALYEAAREANQ